ncbi:MAG: ribonucleoside-diphosphate reductase subunit alpha [Verrucomicrobiales bacterium]
MIERDFIVEDLQLKEQVRTPKDQKPSFNWRDVDLQVPPEPLSSVKIVVGGEKRDFDPAEIAQTVGSALTDLHLAKRGGSTNGSGAPSAAESDEIFNTQNRRLVALIARSVTEEIFRLAHDLEKGGEHVLDEGDIGEIITRSLIRQNAHEVAKSLILRLRRGAETAADSGKADAGGAAGTRISVIRRNGQLVPWKTQKIDTAVTKAFLSVHLDPGPAAQISEAVTERMKARGVDYVHMEDIQDAVQEELMRGGHFKVAEHFIIYRHHRAQARADESRQREQELQEAANQDSMIVVKTEDGSFLWDGIDLKKRIEFAMLGLDLCLSFDEIERELRRSIYPEMTQADLKKTISLNAKTLLERDADFSKFCRILLTFIYEEVCGWNILRDGIEKLPEFHRRAFKENIVRCIEIERLSPKLSDLDIDRLVEAIDPAADLEFDYLGIQTLYDRYLIVDKTAKNHRRLEAPQHFWLRVAMGIFIGEQEGQTDKILSLYNLYKSRRFCSSTPTLFNSGTLHSQLSSCYLYKVDDSIESIMTRGIAENAFLSKWAGGLGGSWTAVRGTGSYIKGTNGESQGVIPFLKLHNDQLVAVNQGGKRRGSGCAYLETWHIDIFDFLELRKNTGDDRRRTHDMNTANWIPDLFMKRMEARQPWTLFRSNEVPELHDLYGKAFEEKYAECEEKARRGEIFGKEVAAIELWKAMLKMLFETGHPWITFKDPCNLRSPQDHCGVIHSSNLCTEITLNTSEDETAVCNLGSVVLDTHVDEEGNIDHEKLRDTIRIAVRALDNVIDINFYPTQAARTANMRHRPVGLGIMGLQNVLYKRGVGFASEGALDMNDEIMEAVCYYAYEASSDLAKERGTYSTYEGSKWSRGILPPDSLELLEQERGQAIDVKRGGKLDWDGLRAKIKSQGMRNSNVIAIAPTATISNIMGSCPCIEPYYKNLYVKSNLGGEFTVLNTYLVRDLKALDLWSDDMRERLKYYNGELEEIEEIPAELKSKYATAFAIEYQWIIDAAARRQKWIDQSQSVNLFLASPEIKTLSHMYRRAWNTGLKTTYYLRTLAASQIEKATVDIKKEVRGFAGQTNGGSNGPPQRPPKPPPPPQVAPPRRPSATTRPPRREAPFDRRHAQRRRMRGLPISGRLRHQHRSAKRLRGDPQPFPFRPPPLLLRSKEMGPLPRCLERLRRVLRRAGIALLRHPAVEFCRQPRLGIGEGGVGGEVVHLIRIGGEVVEFLRRADREALDELVGARVVGGGEDPGAPIRIVQPPVALHAHEMPLDIDFAGRQVADVVEPAVAGGADRIGRSLRQVVVHAIDKLAMLALLAAQDRQETPPVKARRARIAARRLDQGGRDIRVVDERLGPLSLRGHAGPARDQGGVHAGVPVRPFAAGELRALLGGEQHQRLARLPARLQRRHDLADLTIHVGDLRQIAGEVRARARRGGDVWRQRDRLGRVGGGIAHHPRHVRLDQRDDQAERTAFPPTPTGDEFLERTEVVRAGRLAHTNSGQTRRQGWNGNASSGERGLCPRCRPGSPARRGDAAGFSPPGGWPSGSTRSRCASETARCKARRGTAGTSPRTGRRARRASPAPRAGRCSVSSHSRRHRRADRDACNRPP